MARAHKPYPIFVRELQVAEVYDVTPGMRRVVLTGEQLGGFTSDTGYDVAPFRTENADDHVKIVVLDPARPDLRPPVQADGVLDWTVESLERSRDYTPRRFDADAKRLELDFVRHDGGLASDWAETAEPGDRLHVAGPRGTTVLPEGIDWYLLIGDETALPAIARRVEELPEGTPITAVITVPTGADVQPLGDQTDLEVTWILRDVSPADAFLDAVRAVGWREGQVYAWAAGEAGMLRPIRSWLRSEQKVDRTYVDIAGYWRDGASQGEMGNGYQQLQQRADLAVPYAMRAAVSLDLAEHVSDGRATIASLAEAAGADPRGVRKVVRVLAHEGLFTHSPDDAVGLTPRGSVLLEDHVHGRLDHRTGHGRLAAAWPGLLHAVRTGTSGYEAARGRSFWDDLAADDALSETFDDGLADWSALWSSAVARTLVLAEGSHVVDVGGGTGTLLGTLLNAHPAISGTLVELPTTAARAGTELERQGLAERAQVVSQSFFEPLPTGGDVYLLAQVLHDWPDAEAGLILRRAAEAVGTGRVVLVERLAEDQHHDHDLAFDLQMYAVFGSGERTSEEYDALAESAGLSRVRTAQVSEDLYLLEFAHCSLRPRT